MSQKLFLFLIIIFLNFSCSKKDIVIENIPSTKDESYEVYKEAAESMDEGDYFYAAKKFLEAENILPEIEDSAKALLMASYCYYTINFYEEANTSLTRFTTKYPADKNIPYAHYLLIVSAYEQIQDEKKDIEPLLISQEKIIKYLKEFPNTEYALDLKFKLGLINNQLAAKELYIAKYYIEVQKWIPAINRLKIIVDKYSETIFIEEALHRLVEINYNLGFIEEAKKTAALLGYNYNTSEWYEASYKVLNKNYKIPKIKKTDETEGLIKRTIKKLIIAK